MDAGDQTIIINNLCFNQSIGMQKIFFDLVYFFNLIVVELKNK